GRPTAALCVNDLLGLGFLQAMSLRGLKVPGDVAIVGYDDIDFAAAAAVPLSSVRQPRELLGRTAIELLLEEVSSPGEHRHRQVIVQPDLVVRESSEALRENGCGVVVRAAACNRRCGAAHHGPMLDVFA